MPQEPLSYGPITRFNTKQAAVYEVECVLCQEIHKLHP